MTDSNSNERKVKPTHLNELLGVERAVEVSASTHGLGQHHTGRVHRLPAIGEVHSARDLLDQHRRQTLRSIDQK